MSSAELNKNKKIRTMETVVQSDIDFDFNDTCNSAYERNTAD